MNIKANNHDCWCFVFVRFCLICILIFGNVCVFATANQQAQMLKQLEFESFDPKCGNDQSCHVWQTFRDTHPFPYQTFAVAPVKDGSTVLIISEPAPSIPKAKLEKLLHVAFGSDLLNLTNRRWMIGADGWLEDVVLEIKTSTPKFAANPENDPALTDRVRMLQQLLFGTAFGGTIERADSDYAAARSSAPDVAPRPLELRNWTVGASTPWTSLDVYSSGSPFLLNQLFNNDVAGSYINADHQLVILVLPATVLEAIRKDKDELNKLQKTFRLFAVSSDTILGGVWNKEGGLAIVGRSRRTSTAAIPPLRFETFTALVREQSGELKQSYERTNLFAGRLLTGAYQNHDWAPILLSESLVNTEFGALLNITDQFLKSWSEAGDVDYLYFDYPLHPAKGKFVFGDEPLSTIVKNEIGGNEVLFNWNTAGGAVTFADEEFNVLAAGRTSALPVTYGSDVAGEEMQTGDQLPKLRIRENSAYDYFVAQRDPNLARVVSYTLMYQIFRGAQTASKGDTQIDSKPTLKNSGNALLVRQAEKFLAGIEQRNLKYTNAAETDYVDHEEQDLKRAQAVESLLAGYGQQDSVRVKAMANFLAGVDKLTLKRNFDADFREALTEAHGLLLDYYQKYGHNRKQLAYLLANPHGIDTPTVREFGFYKVFQEKKKALLTRDDKNQRLAQSTENEIKAWLENNQANLPSSIQSEEQLMAALPAELREKAASIQAEQLAIGQANKDLEAEAEAFEKLTNRVKYAMSTVASSTQNFDDIRTAFMAANNTEPSGRIKTPSIVVSWDTIDSDLVGGHNLTARTLRIETDAEASAIALEYQADGTPVLRVPPSQADRVAGQAREIARKIEYEKGTLEGVNQLISKQAIMPIRTAQEVLGKASFDPSTVAATRVTTLELGNAQMKSTLMSSLQDSQSFSAVMMRNQDGYLVGAYRQGGAAKCCMLFADTSSTYEFLGKSLKEGDVMVLGEPDPFVRHLAESVAANDDTLLATAAGNGGSRTPPPVIGAIDAGSFEVFGGGGSNSGTGKGAFVGKAYHSGDGHRNVITVLWPFEGNQSKISALKLRNFAATTETTLEGKAATKALSSSQNPAILQMVKWDSARDGKPYITRLEWTNEQADTQVDVVAGLDPAHELKGRQTIRNAVAEAKTDSSVNLITFQKRIKAYIDKQPGQSGIKRIMTIIREGGLHFRIARNDAAGMNRALN
ncbi:MAG TPA: hypothetical protein VIF10_02725 [Methylobacter sp.]|jgi:hypothetical protein